jgi:hypothetical protein
MSNKNYDNSAFWAENGYVYDELQKLLRFVDSIANLPVLTTEKKSKLEKIRNQIININQPNLATNWDISIELGESGKEDYSQTDNRYIKSWTIYFEKNSLEIETHEYFWNDNIEYSGDFAYWGAVYFEINNEHQYIFLEQDINLFIDDALNFKNYTKEGFEHFDLRIDYEE